MKTTNKKIYVILLLAILIGSYFFVRNGDSSRKENQVVLRKIRDAIDPGDPIEKVYQTFENLNNNKLKIQNPDINNVYISAPLEFGGSNWVLYVELRDSKVTAVKTRTADGPPPVGGPEDKTAGKK